MTTYRSGAYGPNPNSGVNVNSDHSWGGYQYPRGVPGELLGVASYQDIRVTVRKELAPLWALAFQIIDQVHHYKVWTHNPNGNGEPYGPWSYENRKIAGSNTPSNHSKGKACDINAPWNPYANGFANIYSDFPPAMVRDLESIGLCWGGRYGDAMHFEFGYAPSDIYGFMKKALAILGQGGSVVGTPAPTPTPTPTPDDEDDQMMRIAVAKDSSVGAVFAYSINGGRFIHVSDPDHLAAGQAAGLLPTDRGKDYITDRYGLDVLRDLCVGNGAGKGDNLVNTAPSDIARP